MVRAISILADKDDGENTLRQREIHSEVPTHTHEERCITQTYTHVCVQLAPQGGKWNMGRCWGAEYKWMCVCVLYVS